MSPVKYFVSIAGGVVLRLVRFSQVKSPNAKGALATESSGADFIVLLFENNLLKNVNFDQACSFISFPDLIVP